VLIGDFAGNWVKEDATDDPSTAKSCTGYVNISYAKVLSSGPPQVANRSGSPLLKVNIRLSESLRIAIVMMNLLKEMQQHG
jgi:hypothetical protein